MTLALFMTLKANLFGLKVVHSKTIQKRIISLSCNLIRGTQREFLENICSEDDLRSRIFGTFCVKFLC